ncbi:MAG TPA: redoxin domain-containing protein [Bryobacteraceae bacterium]|jgi:peroxiredoxin
MKACIPLILLGATLSGASLPRFSLADATGASHTDNEWRSAPAVVLYFITTDCPISNGYVPEMNRIAKDYEARGVRFYGVIADTDTPLNDVRKHVRDFAYTFPVLIDPHQVLVQFTGATITPQAALLGPRNELKYLGRIDNQYESLGNRRTQATRHEVRDALDAVLAGKRVAAPSAPAVGCSINRVDP